MNDPDTTASPTGRATRARESLASLAALFTSTGTLVCCALPIALVTLGFGGAVAGLTGSAPWLVELSRHKAWVFAGSGALLAGAGWLLYRPGRACPADPVLARRCERADRLNRVMLWVSISLWTLGFAAAYLLLPLRLWLES